MSSWCDTVEIELRAKREYERLRRNGHGTTALAWCQHEHEWRQAGEQAIRQEMERRLEVYFVNKRSRRKAG